MEIKLIVGINCTRDEIYPRTDCRVQIELPKERKKMKSTQRSKWHAYSNYIVLFSILKVSLLAFVGRFFEVLIGAKPGSLWRLLSTVGILYALEPILTVLFVTNMNFMWEKVMSRLRAQIFGRLLIQKVIFFFPLLITVLECLLVLFSICRAIEVDSLYAESSIQLCHAK